MLEAMFDSYEKWRQREEGKGRAKETNRKKFSGPVGEQLREELRGH